MKRNWEKTLYFPDVVNIAANIKRYVQQVTANSYIKVKLKVM